MQTSKPGKTGGRGAVTAVTCKLVLLVLLYKCKRSEHENLIVINKLCVPNYCLVKYIGPVLVMHRLLWHFQRFTDFFSYFSFRFVRPGRTGVH